MRPMIVIFVVTDILIDSPDANVLLSRLFDGSVYGLVSHLLRSEEVSGDELVRLRKLIEEEEQRQ